MPATLPTVEYLAHGDNDAAHIHVVNVNGSAVVVTDRVLYHEVGGSHGETYLVHGRFGVARSCTCPAGRYNRVCRHRLAVNAVTAQW